MTQTAIRYHSLDALRGIMMLLGIWLHAVVAYSQHGGWPWKDGSVTPAFDWSLGLIHFFRMPVFYVMAGFFAALLIDRRGVAAFARNRALRILLPLVAGWLIIHPVTIVLCIVGHELGKPDLLRNIGDYFASGGPVRNLHPLHLWFLEYLLVLYVLALALRAPLLRLPGIVALIDRAFRRALDSRLRWVVFPALIFPSLCAMRFGWIDDPGGFVPEPRIVLAYAIFFAFGWLLWRQADLLEVLARPKPIIASFALGVASFLIAFVCHELGSRSTGVQARLGHFGVAGFHAFSTWLLAYASIGAFVRYFEKPTPWLRYLADSSYWLYIVHLPVLLVLQIAIARTGWHPAVKILVVFLGSIPILIASYHYLVRPTWVGALLNGRRYPIRSGGT